MTAFGGYRGVADERNTTLIEFHHHVFEMFRQPEEGMIDHAIKAQALNVSGKPIQQSECSMSKVRVGQISKPNL